MLPLLLLLLLLPSLALAQLPPPVTWSVVASTCVPDDRAASLVLQTSAFVTLRPGVLTPQPVRLRCPIPLQGRWSLHALQALVRDPDGLAPGAYLTVKLKRMGFVDGTPTALTIVHLDTRLLPATGDMLLLLPWGDPLPLDFSRDTFWIELGVFRTSVLVRPPRLYSVGLRLVPVPSGS